MSAQIRCYCQIFINLAFFLVPHLTLPQRRPNFFLNMSFSYQFSGLSTTINQTIALYFINFSSATFKFIFQICCSEKSSGFIISLEYRLSHLPLRLSVKSLSYGFDKPHELANPVIRTITVADIVNITIKDECARSIQNVWLKTGIHLKTKQNEI